MNTNKIIQGDAIEELKKLPENSVDAIITDPPYGLQFMGKEWDTFSEYKEKSQTDRTKRIRYYKPDGTPVYWFQPTYLPKNFKFVGKNQDHKNKLMENFFFIWATECLRVLKPGGFLLSFGGTRTYHRMTCGIEDAGFEIRDTIMWLYGSGFPKSLNIGKQIDKMAEEDIEVIKEKKELGNWLKEMRLKKNLSTIKLAELGNFYGKINHGGGVSNWEIGNNLPIWETWLRLKKLLDLDDRFDYLIEGRPKDYIPAEREVIGKNKFGASSIYGSEIYHNRKENKIIDITLPATQEAQQWEGWGTALKPACEPIVVARKPLSEKNVALNVLKHGTGGINIDVCRIEGNKPFPTERKYSKGQFGGTEGQGTNHMIKTPTEYKEGRFPANIILDEDAGKLMPNDENEYGDDFTQQQTLSGNTINNSENKSASRFFYCAKASKSERNFGCDDFEPKAKCEIDKMGGEKCSMKTGSGNERNVSYKNNHPTVKPIKLMEYLIKLVSQEGAIILDPFLGSGTTAIACLKLNRKFIGIEKEEEYVKIAKARIKPFLEQRKL